MDRYSILAVFVAITAVSTAFHTGPSLSSHTCAIRQQQRSLTLSPLNNGVPVIDDPKLLVEQVAGLSVFIGSGYVLESREGVEEEEEEVTEGGEVDIYRDTPLRYMGYMNEVGEAFRPVIPVTGVYLGYVVAIVYVFADAISKARKAPKISEPLFKAAGMTKSPSSCSIPALVDVLSFQLLASVIIPGFTINRWVAFCELVIEKMEFAVEGSAAYDFPFNDLIVEWGATAGGLLLIPLIIKPIDFLVEQFLDRTLRTVLDSTFPVCSWTPSGEQKEN